MFTVEFAGELHTVTQSLTFGRAADLCVDENVYMHRIVGEFYLDAGLWWLRNRGGRIPLTLIADDGKRVELPPGAVQALSGGGGVVRFQADRSNYELSFSGVPAAADATGMPAAADDDVPTLHFSVQLTPREVDFLVSFCTPQFSQVANRALPSYTEVAEVWGVSVKTLDNTLQNLRRKIKEAGLVGVDSVDTLVSFVMAHGLITQRDIDWGALGSPDGPRPATTGPRFGAADTS